MLYRPELGPSTGVVLIVLALSAVLGVLVDVLWSGRLAAKAPADQQREAEEHA